MSSATKAAFAAALKNRMTTKPIDKITVKDLVDLCGVNRQTFYYHFDGVYDLLEWVFEQDTNAVLPKEIVYNNWSVDVFSFFKYLSDNRLFVMNVYNSNSRLYMLRFLQSKVETCIRSFLTIVAEGKNIEHGDFEFVVEFYSTCVIGCISRWLDMDMNPPANVTQERLLLLLTNSIESILQRFTKE